MMAVLGALRYRAFRRCGAILFCPGSIEDGRTLGSIFP
jgi:hypothetical protein